MREQNVDEVLLVGVIAAALGLFLILVMVAA